MMQFKFIKYLCIFISFQQSIAATVITDEIWDNFSQQLKNIDPSSKDLERNIIALTKKMRTFEFANRAYTEYQQQLFLANVNKAIQLIDKPIDYPLMADILNETWTTKSHESFFQPTFYARIYLTNAIKELEHLFNKPYKELDAYQAYKVGACYFYEFKTSNNNIQFANFYFAYAQEKECEYAGVRLAAQHLAKKEFDSAIQLLKPDSAIPRIQHLLGNIHKWSFDLNHQVSDLQNSIKHFYTAYNLGLEAAEKDLLNIATDPIYCDSGPLYRSYLIKFLYQVEQKFPRESAFGLGLQLQKLSRNAAGENILPDIELAISYFKKPILENDAEAQYQLGYIYIRKFIPDTENAVSCWLKASKLGSKNADSGLGQLFYKHYQAEKAKLVDQFIPSHIENLYNQAFHYLSFFEKLEGNDASVFINTAMHFGNLLLDIDFIPPNQTHLSRVTRAYDLFKFHADQEYAPAQLCLSTTCLYFKPPFIDDAIEYSVRALKQGVAPAANQLALIFSNSIQDPNGNRVEIPATYVNPELAAQYKSIYEQLNTQNQTYVPY